MNHIEQISTCEQELLHLSGHILSHGTLIVANEAGCITHYAKNIADFFIYPPTLHSQLPDELQVLASQLSKEPGKRLIVEHLQNGMRQQVDVIISRGENGQIILEFLSSRATDIRNRLYMGLPVMIQDEESLLEARKILVNRVAELTGFQRVMYYLFHDNGDGEVVAEARLTDAYGSYLGLRFPDSDIPHIARALYIKNPWRLIPDVVADAVPIVGEETPVDLSFTDLRSVSEMHRVYLQNMGVRASLSFPIVVSGKLFALIAAHHQMAAYPTVHELQLAQSEVKNHTLTLISYLSQRRLRLIDSIAQRFKPFEQILQRHGDLGTAWPELGAWLIEEFNADGAILVQNNLALGVGLCFSSEALDYLDHWFVTEQSELIWSSDHLHKQVDGMPLSEIAGVLAIKFGRPQGDSQAQTRVYLTRAEYVYEVEWGGTPEKPIEYHDGLLGIAPRRSFEKWVEKRLGYSRPWTNENRLFALKCRETLLQEKKR
ncbi:GAF domain-containing protein [Leeia sp. TBRC 13508]|uniref:GAF domain-containing protein n=1 Tax=Leeia speluncae TaxID=2884804 RepID=A0ABS8D8N1_9NEIS|nr:GAF domain-containing protein [Leeia speluncae]MCB6184565.1 GAF domain-containing protein [Leeia speluncae]